jgi:cobalt-zinc-cadmium efflux system outer membrane protein
MNVRTLRWVVLTVGLLVAGCLYPVQEKIDYKVCNLAARPRDLAPEAYEVPRKQMPPPDPQMQTGYRVTDAQTSEMLQVALEDEPKPPEDGLSSRLKFPPDLPGGNVPPIELPKLTPENAAKREEIIKNLYPPLTPVGPNVQPRPGPNGHALTLADLQRLALANSPLITQAVANVEAARGAAIQAGAYPNPTLGYEANSAGTNGTSGLMMFSVSQVIKTMNKLQLARASATMDLANAELALRRAETDLAAQVRGQYFAVLVARENMRVSGALAKFTSDIYDIQVEQVRKGGIAAAYEPAQLRVLANQARGNLVAARSRYTSAWKQLASALGLPGMPPTELAGRIDIPIPRYDHKKVLARALEQHTDILTARNTMLKNQFNLKLARVTPVPDPTIQWSVSKDYSGPPQQPVSTAMQISFPFPVWDYNQGGIIQAQGNLVNASEEEHRVRDALTTTLADAFERYETNRFLLELYRDQMLPDQVRAYRGVYQGYLGGAARIGNPPTFGDVVNAQQTLASTLTTYITTLGLLWQAVVDVANVMQTDDLFQLDGEPQPTLPVCRTPELEGLPPLPCEHPCSPLGDPRLRGMDGDWPSALPR